MSIVCDYRKKETLMELVYLTYKQYMFDKWHIGQPGKGLLSAYLDHELKKLGGCVDNCVIADIIPLPDPDLPCPTPLPMHLIVTGITGKSFTRTELMGRTIAYLIVNGKFKTQGYTLFDTLLTFTDSTYLTADAEVVIHFV